MSYDADYPQVYMVELQSGRTIYVSQYSLDQVMEYCSLDYENDPVKAIYKELYVAEVEDA
jgi:hypothetical protein